MTAPERAGAGRSDPSPAPRFVAGLLDGRRIAVSGAAGGPGPVIAAELSTLGASVHPLDDPDPAHAATDEAQATRWASERAPLHALVHCCAFRVGGAEALRDTLARTWVVARAVATETMLEGSAGGKLVFVASPTGAGPLASALGDGLESLARTLSVEWARFRTTAVTVVPGAVTTDRELAQLACFLVSPAGDYLSGCRIDLGVTAPPASR